MADHKSTKKHIRSSEKRRLRNKYQLKTARTFVKRLRESGSKAEAEELYKKVSSMIDKLAKRGVIHKNKAANNKSKLAKFVSTLS